METSQVLLLSCLMLASISQINGLKEKGRFVSATVGDNVVLRCTSEDNTKLGGKDYWYKQSLGMKPELMSSFIKYEKKSKFHGEYHGSKRFLLDSDKRKNDLYITDTVISDSAVYHCINCYLHQCEFLETITVIVQGSTIQAKVQQPPLQDAAIGRPVILSCSVQFGSCDGRHRVHWFRQSEESTAGVLYSHGGGSSDQCERNPDAPTNSCVYSLNVSSEQTGTYYCAVATCGRVLFGNGTRVEIKVDWLLYVVSGALAFSSVLVVALALSLCRMKKKYDSLCSELKSQFGTATMTTGEHMNQDADGLNYAALNVHPVSRRQRITETETGCVYASVLQD